MTAPIGSMPPYVPLRGTNSPSLARLSNGVRVADAPHITLRDESMRLAAEIQSYEAAHQNKLGALIKADLNVEKATTLAMDVKQQLASQSLSIANERPQVILSQFG